MNRDIGKQSAKSKRQKVYALRVIARQWTLNLYKKYPPKQSFQCILERLLRCLHFCTSTRPMSRNDVKLVKAEMQTLHFPFSFSLFTHFRQAFSLAEVLITLGIIGVIAAITIPNLITNYQKQQTAVQLKKAYSAISEVFQRSSTENGMPSNWDMGTTNNQATGIVVMETYVTPYLSFAENCGYNMSGKCARKPKYFLDKSTAYVNQGYQVTLKDGSVWNFALDGGPPASQIDIFVDLNGDKAPNLMGKDGFFLYFIKGYNRVNFWRPNIARATLLGTGAYGCNKKASAGAGMYCGQVILLDGWQISDEYPW